MDWREVVVKVEEAAVDAVNDILMDCGAGGVVIEDPALVRKNIADNIWDAYDFTEEFLNRDYIEVKAYLPCDNRLNDRIGQLEKMLEVLNSGSLTNLVKGLSFSEVREEDWAHSWKRYYKPVKAGEKIVIKPTWEEYNPAPNDLIVELDPGMAFGTGTHPTTVMCIKFLEQVIKGGETVFDIGTGSGVLAIVAAKLGAREIKAVDIDNVAVESAKTNVSQNHVSYIVEVMQGNLLEKVKGQADVAVANIVADVIILVCPDVAKVVKPGGKFIASGIIWPRAEEVIEEVKQAGFTIMEVAREGEWVSLLAVRKC